MTEAAWSVLGLECTADEGKIRKAYLSRLPDVHPEEDPEGFRALREAYEFALEYARSDIADAGAPETDTPAPPEDPVVAEAQQWVDQLSAVANDPGQRFLEAAYYPLFESLEAFALPVRYLLAQPTFNWALDHQWLPNRVLKQIRDLLDWPVLLPQYPPEQIIHLEHFLEGLEREDSFNLATLSHVPASGQNVALRYFSTLTEAFAGGDLSAISGLLNEQGALVIPVCPRLTRLVIRCHVAIAKPVADVWLRQAEQTLADCSAEDAAWLLANLHFHRKSYLEAMAALQPLISSDSAPAIKSFIIELYRCFCPEWVPLWTWLLSPDIHQKPDAADCMVLLMAKQSVSAGDSNLNKCILSAIDSILAPSKPVAVSGMVSVDRGESLSLESLYGLVERLKSAPGFLDALFESEDTFGPDKADDLSFRIAQELIKEHQASQLAEKNRFDELIESAAKNRVPAVDRSTLMHAINYRPEMPYEVLETLAKAAGIDRDRWKLFWRPGTILDWVELRLKMSGKHWIDRAAFPENEDGRNDCLCFGFLLDCCADALWEAPGRELMARVCHQPEDSIFKSLAGLILGLVDGAKDIEDVKEYCQVNLLFVDSSGFGPTFARFFTIPPMSTALLRAGVDKESLPDASWVPVLAAMLGASGVLAVENLLFYSLLTLDKDLRGVFSKQLAGRELPALDKATVPSGARLAEVISMAPVDRDKANQWGENFPAFVQPAVDVLACLNQRSLLEQPSREAIRKLYATYIGERAQEDATERLLCGMLLGSLKKELQRTYSINKPKNNTVARPFWFGGVLDRRGFALHMLGYFAITLAWWNYPASFSLGAAMVFVLALAVTMLSSLVRRMRDAGLGPVAMIIASLVSIGMPVVGLVIFILMFFKPSVPPFEGLEEYDGLILAMAGNDETVHHR